MSGKGGNCQASITGPPYRPGEISAETCFQDTLAQMRKPAHYIPASSLQNNINDITLLLLCITSTALLILHRFCCIASILK